MQIYGSKKGQGKQRQPVIAPDSAQSKAYLNMLYGLGEGEILGLANGYKSVYLDGTPLQNESGEFNFPSVKVDFRTGTNDQEYIDGFPDVSSETAVNVELKHGTPYIKAFNNLDLDALRVRLKWGALRSQNAENGDVNGVKIDYAIDLKTDNGGWVQVLSPSVNAKTSDAYERSHRIDLPPATTGWQVRVRRLTPNSKSDYVSDKMFVSAIAEVIDLKLRYPNTALLGLRCDATSFNNVPKMSARCKGLIIKVPTNYDPVSRTYDGLWNGEFKLAYSNNPAWVYYDLCTNARYGLGNRLTPAMIDKWSLYRLAQYCDQMVDDGMGGQEPRFTVNVYIQSAEGAFELLSKLAGVFRAISYWDGNSIVVDADIPQDSIYSFSRANVIDGVFEYTGTRARDRHTVAKVAWDNPNNHFKTEYEFVRDEQAIAKFGVRIADISAWGCTSKGQAQRAGLWALKSEQLETRMVTFKVGLDGFIPAPAKVIEISDELFAGRANGGRVVAINKNKTVITLDRPITAKANDTLIINGDDGFSQRRLIKSINGDKITVTKAFGDISVENVWVLDSQDLATMKFRVLSVTADDNHTFTITAVQYNPAKYDAIDTGAYIDERPISVINPTVQAPTKSVNLSSYHTVNQGVSVTTLVIGWEQVTGAVKYQVEWRKDNGNWQSLPPTGTNSIEVAGVYAGAYEAKVTAISAFGQASIATHSTLTQIHGKQGKPNKLARLTATGKLFAMDLNWAFGAKSDDTNFTEIQVSPDGRSNITTLGTFAYPTNKHEITGLQGGLTQYYRARIMDKLGNTSDWTAWVSGTTEARADKVLDILSGQINQSHLDQTLRTPIAKISTLESAVNAVNGQLPTLNGQIATLNGKATTLQNELNTAKNTLQTAVGNITTERNRINTAIRDISVLQTVNNAKTQEIANLTQTVGGHTSSIRELGVTTGDLSQKYSQLKTASDTANSEITAIKQTQNGQATSIDSLNSELANKATSANLNTLRQAMVSADIANTQAINNLQSSMQTALLAKLDASAITHHYTKAETDNVVGGKIEQFNASLIIGGRNLVLGSDKYIGDTNNPVRYMPFDFVNHLADIKGKDVILSLDIEYSNITQAGRIGFESSLIYTDGSTSYLQCWENVSVGSSGKKRIYAKHKIKDLRFSLSQKGIYIQAVGRIKIGRPMLQIGTKQTDWTPAPEDLQADIDSKATIANLTSETTARTNADTALTQRIDSLQTDYNSNKASVANQLKTLSDKDTATASQISSLTANVSTAQNTANTANSKADTATTKADNAQSTANNALSRANTANSAITTEQKARADADTALGQRISAIDTAYKSADNATNAKLANAEKAISDNNTALSQRITALDTAYKKSDTDITARLAREETARANADNANTQALRILESTVSGIGGRVGTSESKIATLERTTADTNQALATAQSQLTAKYNDLSARGITRPNLCPDVDKWVLGTGFLINKDSDWGMVLKTHVGGTRVCLSPKIAIRAGGTYVLTYDSLRFSDGGEIYCDLQGYNYQNQMVWDSESQNRTDRHDFSTTNGNRERNSKQFTIPNGVTHVQVRFVCQNITGSNVALGIRQVKFEYGSLPATAYSQEADTIALSDKANQTTASLDEFKQTVATKDLALTQKIDSLTAEYKQADNALSASLQNEVMARTSGDNALSQRIDVLQADYNGNKANIASQLKTLSDKEQALSQRADSLNASFNDISARTKTRVNLLPNGGFENGLVGWSSNTDFVLEEHPSFGRLAVIADVSSKTGTFWLLSDKMHCEAGRTYVISCDTASYAQTCRVYCDLLFFNAQNQVILDGNQAAFDNNHDYGVVPNRHEAQTQAPLGAVYMVARFVVENLTGGRHIGVRQIKVEVGHLPSTPYTVDTLGKSLTASINEVKQTIATQNQAMASQISTLQTTANGQTTSIRNVEQSVNGVRAIKAVTVDNNGFISGYGLMSELQNGRVTSRFGINADQIYFGATTSAKKPFIFATTPTTIDGVSYPAGAWFNSAHIARASINMLHIADSIQSDNYVQGRSGWRLFKNGELEINSSFGDGTRIQLNSRGLTGWYGNGQKAFELGILS